MAIQSLTSWLNENLTQNTKQIDKTQQLSLNTDKNETVDHDSTAVQNHNKEGMIKDLDSIINSLETLSKEITEELEEFENINLFLVERSGTDSFFDKFKQWILIAPKARKAVAKLNKIKLNRVDLYFAAENAPNSEQKKALNSKLSELRDRISEIQAAINDRFANSGQIVQRAIAIERLKGELAVAKRQSGMEDDPIKKKSLAEKMQEIQNRYAEESAALKKLEPSEDEKKKMKEEKLKREKEKESKDTEKETSTDQKQDTEKKEPTDQKQDAQQKEEPIDQGGKKNTKEDKLARVEELIKKEKDKISKKPEAEKIKSKISELETAVEDLKNKEKKDKADQDKIDMITVAINAEKKKLDKIEGSEKLDKLNKLKDKIAAKENWQLDGTELGRLYEMEISKLEAEFILNEARYTTVADKFRILLR